MCTSFYVGLYDGTFIDSTASPKFMSSIMDFLEDSKWKSMDQPVTVKERKDPSVPLI